MEKMFWKFLRIKEKVSVLFVKKRRKETGMRNVGSDVYVHTREGRLVSWKAGLGTCPSGITNLEAHAYRQYWNWAPLWQ